MEKANRRNQVGRLEFEPLRDLFKDEARNFTTWLEEHIEVLGERLGLELTLVEREKAVGDFNVDLLCADKSGRKVIVENQLEKTDHDHLGKLLTYLVNLDAAAAIWVTSEPRAEHQKVVEWLNETTGADRSFYLVKVEAVRVGDSELAPLFTVMSSPDSQTKEFGEERKEWADRDVKRAEFWKRLLDRSKGKTPLFSNTTPGRSYYISTGAGKSGVVVNYVIPNDYGVVELYIDHDRDTGAKNKKIFDALFAQKTAIEEEFGEPLDWERLDEKRACRIAKRFTNGGLAKPETWDRLQDQMIDAMVRLNEAMRGRLAKIEV